MPRAARLLLLLFLLQPVAAATQEKAPSLPPAAGRSLRPLMWDGETLIRFGGGGWSVLAERGPVAGLAVGPDRDEVAYCAPTAEGRAALWLVYARRADEESSLGPLMGGSASRLLWIAPKAAALEGPVWWSPNGEHIVVRVNPEDGTQSLVSIDYVTGDARVLAAGPVVLDFAWSTDGTHVAFIQRTGEGAQVYMRPFPEGSPICLGEGSSNLRWSPNGRALSWILRRESEWREMFWEQGTDGAAVRRKLPPRPPDAILSPDGRLVAFIGKASKALTICPVARASGDTVVLGGVSLLRVLGWSPDSRLVLVLADGNAPVAVSAKRWSDIRDDVVQYHAMSKALDGAGVLGALPNPRAALAGPPLDPRAGPPSWSSSGDLLVYLSRAKQPVEWLDWQGSYPWPEDLLHSSGRLLPGGQSAVVAVRLARYFRSQQQIARTVSALQLTWLHFDLERVARALVAFAADHGGHFPEAASAAGLCSSLEKYLPDGAAMLDPLSPESLPIHYILPTGTCLSDLVNPATTPTLTLDCIAGYHLVAYADGHVENRVTGQ